MFREESRAPSFVAALFVGIGLALVGYFIGVGLERFRTKTVHSVRVKGLSEREVKSDFALWELGFKASSRHSLSEAKVAFMQSRQEVKAFLDSHGFSAKEVTETTPRTSVSHRVMKDEQFTEYEITGSFVMRSHNVDKVQKHSAETAQLIEKDVMLNWSAPRYLLRDFDALRPKMLEEATKSARNMAEKFAADSNSQVGSIISADQGHFSIESTEGGYNSEKTVMKKVRVVSHLTYELVGG